MQISDDRLAELQRIYKDEYGEDITIEEAREIAQRLLTLYGILMRPLPGDMKSGNDESRKGNEPRD
jgi:hypothetical protein